MHLYTRPEEPSDRETRVFFFVEAGSQLEWRIWGCRKSDAYGRLRAFPAPQLAGSPGRRGRGGPKAGLPSAPLCPPTTWGRDNPAVR